jgi:hypothetical protein
MLRIYLDTNVFSNLKSNKTELYQELNELIVQYKSNISFYFSQAHIRDKRNDTSDKKFEDFDFMESLVEDNYIAYDPIEKHSSSYLTTPGQVHKDDKDDSVKTILNDFWESDEHDTFEIILLKDALRKMMEMIQVPISIPDFEQLPEEQRGLMEKMLPINKESANLLDWMDQLGNFNEEMFKDNQTYRSLRKMIDEGLNNGKYTTNEGTDFNEAFKDSLFKKTFEDFVKDSLHHKDKTQIPFYDFYLQSYNTLDMLGISKDKVNRGNGFGNMFNDSLHSYFAHYCDVLVSSDKGLRIKSQALYNLYNIDTKILTVEEFIDELKNFGKPTEDNMKDFFDKFTSDYENSERINFTKTNTGYHYTLAINNRYLNAFDEILELIHDEKRYIFLLKKKTHLLSSFNYREEGMVVNKALQIFGEDTFKIGEFNFKKEVKEIENNKWKGRYWNFGSINMSLEHNHVVKQFTLVIWITP